MGVEQISWNRADILEEGNCDTTRALCQSACLTTARRSADLLGDDAGGAKTEEQVCYHAGSFEILAACHLFQIKPSLVKHCSNTNDDFIKGGHNSPTFWSITFGEQNTTGLFSKRKHQLRKERTGFPLDLGDLHSHLFFSWCSAEEACQDSFYFTLHQLKRQF